MFRTWLVCMLTLVGSKAAGAEVFRDCAGCSQMVVISGGTFSMGSPSNEPERKEKFETLRRDVRIETFAIGKTEVTRRQYAAFVKETKRSPSANGCLTYGFGNPDVVSSSDLDEKLMDRRASWRSPGFKQTDEHPVTCISWQDAKDYAAWLARKTGKPYRLPSEAEWEYAARAGGSSIFPWGTDENDACRYANVGDPNLLRANLIIRRQVEAALRRGEAKLRFVRCYDGSAYTTAVGQRKPNAFGLYDMIGNVWEYVEDCRRESLPESGLAYVETSCEFRRVRGGSWDDSPPELRSANRGRVRPNIPRNDGGFRLARDIGVAEARRASK